MGTIVETSNGNRIEGITSIHWEIGSPRELAKAYITLEQVAINAWADGVEDEPLTDEEKRKIKENS